MPFLSNNSSNLLLALTSGDAVKNIFTSASGKTSLYPCPKKQQNKTPTQSETKARELFKERVIQVNNIKKQYPNISSKEAWEIIMKNYEKSN